jgi:hypothetical protein
MVLHGSMMEAVVQLAPLAILSTVGQEMVAALDGTS